MSKRLLLSLYIFFIATSVATADTGDRLYVKFPIVNLRSGPDITSPVILKLKKGRALIEVERQDDWVLVATGRHDIKSGWLYANLLSPTNPDEKPAAPAKDEKPAVQANAEKKTPSAKPDPDGPLFMLFRHAFSEFNEKLITDTGKVCFNKLENPAHGVVQLTVNDDWAALTRAQRQQAMTDIFAIWNAAAGAGMPITVDIVDTDGLRLMSRFRQ